MRELVGIFGLVYEAVAAGGEARWNRRRVPERKIVISSLILVISAAKRCHGKAGIAR
jgi:hypothetical protein